jgi:hypothetical protein
MLPGILYQHTSHNPAMAAKPAQPLQSWCVISLSAIRHHFDTRICAWSCWQCWRPQRSGKVASKIRFRVPTRCLSAKVLYRTLRCKHWLRLDRLSYRSGRDLGAERNNGLVCSLNVRRPCSVEWDGSAEITTHLFGGPPSL